MSKFFEVMNVKESAQLCLLCRGVVRPEKCPTFQLKPVHNSSDCSCNSENFDVNGNQVDPSDSCSCMHHWLHPECLEIIRETVDDDDCSSFPCPDCGASFKLPERRQSPSLILLRCPQDTIRIRETPSVTGTTWHETKDVCVEVSENSLSLSKTLLQSDVNNNYLIIEPTVEKERLNENYNVLMSEFQTLCGEVKTCEEAMMSACECWQNRQNDLSLETLQQFQSTYESIVEDFLGIQESVKNYVSENHGVTTFE